MRVLERLENLHQVVAAIGDPEHPWFQDGGRKSLTPSVYPVPGGALVVERTQAGTGSWEKARYPGERGKFRVVRVSVQGKAQMVKDTPMTLRGAQQWAQREAERLGQED